MTLQSGKLKIVTVGDYRFTGKRLGKGNFARVEEAVHNVLDVKVAIKVIDVAHLKEKYMLKNLYREARIMSKLSHPCIAALYETMQPTDNIYYLVTELMTGGDLCTYIKAQRCGKLDERTTRTFARQFVSALHYMHGMGIVHRDLKMENAILNLTRTRIKIVDFGLSNTWNQTNPLRTHCGSPEYAAPELFIANRKYGPEVDMWSLGIIIYGMAVGALPFVNACPDHLAPKECRKRLVAQISKGIAGTQRQALAVFSSEFRSMIAGLLTVNADERLDIQKLVVHPWITEKGRKIISTDPFKMLTTASQTQIIWEISKIFETIPELIYEEIISKPFGRIGGYYNILSHKRMGNRANENSQVRPPTAPLHRTRDVKVALENRRDVGIETTESDPPIAIADPPKNDSGPKLDYRNIRTPALRRKIYSASIQFSNKKPMQMSKNNEISPTVPQKIKNSNLVAAQRPKSSASAKTKTRKSMIPISTMHHTLSALHCALNKGRSRNVLDGKVSDGHPAIWKRTVGLGGDGDKSSTVGTKQRGIKPVIYDPIARSIADYVLKNVPEKILNNKY